MSPTYANVADICQPHVLYGSPSKVVRSLVVRPFPRPCRATLTEVPGQRTVHLVSGHSRGSQPMSDGTSNPARYFGQQVRRARRAAGWTLTEFGQRIGYDPGQISRIENGKRPPTELFPQRCDGACPDRDGWFGEFYAESRTWIATPPWFRSWVEHEQQAASLRIWQLGVLSGLLQTEDYARGILTVEPGVTEDQVSERLAARLARQGVLVRDDPPTAWFLVDEAVLHRCVGSAEGMAAQLAHLGGRGRPPNLTIPVGR